VADGTSTDRSLEQGPEDARREARDQGAPPPEQVTAVAGVAAAPAAPARAPRGPSNLVLALVFLAPALVLLVGILIYPIVWTVVRSLYDRAGDSFVGLGNYTEMFRTERTRTAIRNNMIWVAFGPTIATAIGLVYAVLAERVRWQRVFKVAVFMPMAISGLAVGVIFTLVYQADPDRGLANAAIRSVYDIVSPSGEYRGARPSDEAVLAPEGDALVTPTPVPTGDAVALGLVAIRPDAVPEGAEQARVPDVGADAVGGTVYLDFTPGGGGERGRIDEGERGLPGMEVEVLRDGAQVGTATTDDDGTFVVDGLEPGPHQVRLAERNFVEAFGGVAWLGPTLVTPAIIASWLWIWIGFAMIVIGAGLSAIPRDVLEAARVDGASEWQVFRRVTAPLLTPVLLVVLVTLVINVLKIFDLVLVIAPGAIQAEANVIALEQWRVSFGGAQNAGLGSALSVFLFLLVIPAMAFNIKRFRSEDR
jgi:alpha-glucoside transport system permease protein